MNHREAQLTTSLKKYLQHNNIYKSFACEVKQSPTKLLNYKQNIKDRWHQLAALQLAKHRRLIFKIPDTSLSQLPFDLFCLEGVPAFYAFSFQYPKDKTVFFVDVDVMERELLLTTKKSLSIERARELAFDKITIK